MRTVTSIAVALTLFGASSLMVAARAQSMHSHDHGAAATVAKANEMSEGEIRKIDLTSKRITLKHGPLKNLDMPPMTMPFVVTDPAMLTKWKVGDKVRFVASNPGGVLTLVEMQSAQ